MGFADVGDVETFHHPRRTLEMQHLLQFQEIGLRD